MSEITTTDITHHSTIPTYIMAGFIVLIVFAYFFGLTIPLLGPDEPRYSQVAREMFERADWVTPTLGGAHWFEKPALLYWLQIATYNIFGVSEFSARFGSAIFGLGTIASLWALGRSAVADERAKEFAKWLVLIAASTLGIIVFARGASFDIVVTFPLTAAMTGFFIFDRAQSNSFRAKYLPLIAFYLFIGVALIAKGLIGIVFPFAIVAFYHVLSWRMPSRALIISVFWGTLLAALVAALWYLPMYQQHGYEFIDEFFIQHHFQRFTSNKYLHPQPFIFFFWVLPLMTLPWLPMFFAGVWRAFRGAKGAAPSAATQVLSLRSPIFIFSFAWIAVPLVFFSFSGSKLPGYILPAVPPAIVIAALYVYERVSNSGKWNRAVIAIAAGTLLISVSLLQFVVPRFADIDSTRSLFRAAAERGYANNKVVNLHTISHNAEFYASGRLIRDDNGKLKRLYGASEIKPYLEAQNNEPMLILVPMEYLPELVRFDGFRNEVILDNSELAIVAVSIK
ncbi:MAG: glycosyltransferase family 39 protein [Pyrinomonadaceae bacterium]|nr:glycosyltransferase family 39 protein [Pyrinomonadaceae bacterium]MBP6212069.1 glycosyltransferase family 39 protein [Pyrinomonadaceae bacterium]